MSQNQKLINIFTDFFKNYVGENSYNISSFKLTESYADCILVKTSPGGSSGGSCWGGSTCQYNNSDDQIISSLASSIRYNFSFLKDDLNIDPKKLEERSLKYAQKLISGYSYISEESDGGDYYGNYTKYRLYKIKLLEFIKPLITPEQFEVFQGMASNHKLKADKKFKNNLLIVKEAEILKKLKDFDSTKNQERLQLHNNLEQLKKEIKQVENSITNFNAKTISDKDALHKQLAEVMVELTVPEQKQEKKRKLK